MANQEHKKEFRKRIKLDLPKDFFNRGPKTRVEEIYTDKIDHTYDTFVKKDDEPTK